MLSEVEISQFITTKLCHDLSGTLGAISSSLEFLDSDNIQMREKALSLARSSSLQTISRLIFFRQAYGVAKAPGEANLDEIKKVAFDYLSSTKVQLDFHEKFFHIKDLYISANLGKLLLCIIQQAYSNLIHGGTIKVEIANEYSQKKILIIAEGANPKIDQEKLSILNGQNIDSELTTQNCTAHFSYRFSQLIETKISTTFDANTVTYEILF